MKVVNSLKSVKNRTFLPCYSPAGSHLSLINVTRGLKLAKANTFVTRKIAGRAIWRGFRFPGASLNWFKIKLGSI